MSMAILGFNFTKISVEKKNVPRGKINISNNIAIQTVDKGDFVIGATKHPIVKVGVEFTAKFDPNIGQIVLNGDVIYSDKQETIEEIEKDWKKDKKFKKEIMAAVLNSALNKCYIESLMLSRELNLPSPIPLPKFASK